MKNILLIATGGTIASKPTPDGLSPQISSDELLEYVPELRAYGEICPTQLFRLDSTDMTPAHWLRVAAEIRAEYDAYDAFVITHGTDTMAYAAAVLYYLIQNSPKPIVLTGSQRSIYARDSDARENLRDAVHYAASPDACGVHVVFGGHVISGCRARKTRTRSYNAFSSIDYPDVAVFRGDRLCCFIRESLPGPVQFFDRLNSNIAVVKLTPGMSAELFDAIAGHCDAVIIESFGMGGIPFYDRSNFPEKIDRLAARGVRIIVTTQVPHEGSDLSVYEVGHRIGAHALPEVYDMTIEAVVAKTMWALAYSDSAESFRDRFMACIGPDRMQ